MRMRHIGPRVEYTVKENRGDDEYCTSTACTMAYPLPQQHDAEVDLLLPECLQR